MNAVMSGFKITSCPIDMIKPAPYAPEALITTEIAERLMTDTQAQRQPLGDVIARAYQDHYEVIFGLEFYQAYRQALPRNPQIKLKLYHLSDGEAVNMAMALAQKHYNLTLIDMVSAYAMALRHFSWRPTELARALAIKPATLSNRLKLLQLNEDVKALVRLKALSLEHAKILSRLPSKAQSHFARDCIRKCWTTRALYQATHPHWQGKSLAAASSDVVSKDPDHLSFERALSEQLNCPLALDLDPKKGFRGRLKLTFYSLGQLQGLIERLPQRLNLTGELSYDIKGLEHLEQFMK